MHSSWIKTKAVYKRSEREAPFCPYCGDELDGLDMMNDGDECSCGRWSTSINPMHPDDSGDYYRAKNKGTDMQPSDSDTTQRPSKAQNHPTERTR